MKKEKIMKISCPECGVGTATRQKTLFRHRIGNEIFVIPEIEHLVCDNCGYEFLPEDVWEHILHVFRDIKGTRRGVHLCGKITTGKDTLRVDIANIEKHIKLRDGEEVELYTNDNEIVIVSKKGQESIISI